MARKGKQVFVVSIGVRTPVGHCFQSAGAAVRCGISAYTEHPFMIDRFGEPMVVAMDQTIDDWLPYADRCKLLTNGAVGDALAPLGEESRIRIPMLLSIGDHPSEKNQNDAIIQSLAKTKKNLEVTLIQQGHAGALLAVEHAMKSIAGGSESLVLVAGTDSFVDPEKLEWVESEGQLHSINYSWGFTPGEGSGAILLANLDAIKRYRLRPLLEITGIKTSKESNLLGTETVCIGEGLSTAFAGVLSESDKVTDTYCDLNGQTYRAEEYGFSVCRLGKCFEDASKFVAPAECWGDVGAASPVLGISLAAASWKGKYSNGSNAIVWSSSAKLPLRGAVLLKEFVWKAAA